jgi:hypothetical protein
LKAYVYSTTKMSRFGGWRVTIGGEDGAVVSLWGNDLEALYNEALKRFEATPEPIDAILEATMWHGKRATA